jgi:hypothetical protein
MISTFPKCHQEGDNKPEIAHVRENDRWRGPVLLAGSAYAAVGVVFGVLAGASGSHEMTIFWRWAAWAVSAAMYATHIGYERFRLRNSTGSTALHVAAAVAVGAFGLAVAAGAHALFASSPQNLRLYVLALVAWPIVTAVPAYLVALVVSAALSRVRPRVGSTLS